MEKGKGLVLSDKRFNEDIGYMKSLHIFILFQHDSGIETDHPAIAHDMRFHLAFVVDGHDRFERFRRNQNLLTAPWADNGYVQQDFTFLSAHPAWWDALQNRRKSERWMDIREGEGWPE